MDMTLSYAQIDAVESAVAYFRRNGASLGLDYINHLAVIYFDMGKYEQAVRIYTLLLAEHAVHAKAPEWRQKMQAASDKVERRR